MLAEIKNLRARTEQHLPGGFVVLDANQSYSARIAFAQRYDFRAVGAGTYSLGLRERTVQMGRRFYYTT